MCKENSCVQQCTKKTTVYYNVQRNECASITNYLITIYYRNSLGCPRGCLNILTSAHVKIIIIIGTKKFFNFIFPFLPIVIHIIFIAHFLNDYWYKEIF